MSIVKTSSLTDDDGVSEVEELDNGIVIKSLIEPSETYLASRPATPDPKPTELKILGQQLVEKDLQILELEQENQVLGQQMVDIDLRLLMGGM